MSLWDNLKDKVSAMNSSLQTNIGKFKNADFANGTMAMCAMIAAADGSISGPEKAKIASLITQNDTLRIFPAAELKSKFDHYCDKLTADYDFGKIEAIQAISKLKSKPDQGRALVQIGIIIGGSDGNFDADEKKAVKEACHALGIAASEFDL
ncbi:MAG: Tellurite resistance TerB [Verrucomicrobiales bacterium]|nr:Tellurite resistance TerB [Verrucomicrobiales bacterium]